MAIKVPTIAVEKQEYILTIVLPRVYKVVARKVLIWVLKLTPQYLASYAHSLLHEQQCSHNNSVMEDKAQREHTSLEPHTPSIHLLLWHINGDHSQLCSVSWLVIE